MVTVLSITVSIVCACTYTHARVCIRECWHVTHGGEREKELATREEKRRIKKKRKKEKKEKKRNEWKPSGDPAPIETSQRFHERKLRSWKPCWRDARYFSLEKRETGSLFVRGYVRTTVRSQLHQCKSSLLSFDDKRRFEPLGVLACM